MSIAAEMRRAYASEFGEPPQQPTSDAQWNAWFAASFDNHFKVRYGARIDPLVEAISASIGDAVDALHAEVQKAFDERDKEIASLRSELKQLRADLTRPNGDA